MKNLSKIILTGIALGLMAACSTPESSECKKVNGKQIKYKECGGGLKCPVFYFMLNGDSQQIEVSEIDYNKYNLKDEYCK